MRTCAATAAQWLQSRLVLVVAFEAMTGEVKMKGYSIAVIDVHDQDKYMSEYLPTAVKLYEAAGGKALVRGGKTAGDHARKGESSSSNFLA
jgi:hypothetical protein